MKILRNIRFTDLFERVERKFLLNDSQEYNCVGVRWYGMGAFVRERQLGAEISRKQQWIIRADDIVYNKLFAWKGAFAVADKLVDGCIVSDKFPTYQANTELVDLRWLEHYFRTPLIAQQAEALSKGAAAISKLTLNPPQFWELSIPLPPLAEQRRIVARIEGLAVQIHEARSLRQQAAEQTKALSRSGTEEAFQKVRKRVGTKTLSDVCNTITDGDHNTPEFSDNGVRFIFVGNVSTGRLHFENSKRVSLDYFKTLKPHRLPQRGDILYSAVGATLGIPAIVDSDEPFCFQRHVAILKPDRNKVDSRFVWHMLSSRTVTEKAWASTTGSAQPTIPLRAIRELPIPVPPLSEQHRIVAELDVLQAEVDTLKRLQAETAAELDAMLPSILDKAFKGEL